jgi:hypothetical protein
MNSTNALNFFYCNAMIEMEQCIVFFNSLGASCKHHATTFTRSAGRASVVRFMCTTKPHNRPMYDQCMRHSPS